MSLFREIKNAIESSLGLNRPNRISIFPYGEIGMMAKQVMNECYDLEPYHIYDNKLHKYNKKILPLDNCENDEIVLFMSTDVSIYEELYKLLEIYCENIIELDVMKHRSPNPMLKTQIGKYSHGKLCRNHPLIEKIGAFCSFADGAEVVSNHPMEYISTHPFIFAGMVWGKYNFEYSKFSESYLIEGVQPRNIFEARKRITIGNDVWLGANVLICNGANIGNGVVAGAGSIITKDVPDYAVVVGAPARIIKYRYSQQVIEGLNYIKWWDWDDDLIRERYYDFYLSGEEFVKKYM